MTDPAKALLDATLKLLVCESLNRTGASMAPQRQLAAITQADPRMLVDLLRDCAMFLSDQPLPSSGTSAVLARYKTAILLLARCDNVLDAHDYDANEGEKFAVKEPRDPDQFLDGRRGR